MASKPKASTLEIGTEQIKLLENLSNAVAVSGDERAIREIVRGEIEDIADDIQVDVMGNLLVTRKGRGKNRLRVMVAAHMDEVGFMLVDDEKEGIFAFELVGGIDARQLVGKPVLVGDKNIPGVIGAAPIHLVGSTHSIMPVKSLRIDIGPEGGTLVKVGDRATFATRFKQVGPSLMGKALDDRLGVATLIELVKNPPKNVDLLAVFTVQEEVGLRGARVAAYRLNPDIGIAIDATPAYDFPAWDGEENSRYNTRLGAGPALYVVDGATISDPRLVQHFTETGDSLGIPYQFRQPGRGGTDAGTIHKQREGIPSISISVPNRNAHTAVGIVRLSDWQNLARLVHSGINRLTPDVLKRK